MFVFNIIIEANRWRWWWWHDHLDSDGNIALHFLTIWTLQSSLLQHINISIKDQLLLPLLLLILLFLLLSVVVFLVKECKCQVSNQPECDLWRRHSEPLWRNGRQQSTGSHCTHTQNYRKFTRHWKINDVQYLVTIHKLAKVTGSGLKMPLSAMQPLTTGLELLAYENSARWFTCARGKIQTCFLPSANAPTQPLKPKLHCNELMKIIWKTRCVMLHFLSRGCFVETVSFVTADHGNPLSRANLYCLLT